MSLKNCCGDAGAGPGVHAAGNLFAPRSGTAHTPLVFMTGVLSFTNSGTGW